MIYYSDPTPDEDRIKMCNCAKCKKELLGMTMWGEKIPLWYKREFVFGILARRPYCWDCFSIVRREFANNEILIYDRDSANSLRRTNGKRKR